MVGQRPMTALEFATALDVSRETLARLQAFKSLLCQWQTTINLVGTRTLDDIWRRHFLDSGQLCPLIADAQSIVDIGSGAGFPGLVVAIVTGAPVTLIEADQRKAAFLREAARITGATADIIAGRAEAVRPAPADVVTARAVAPLAKLLALAEPWVKPGGRCYFLKGGSVEEDLTDAETLWNITYDLTPSLSDPAGAIVCVKEFRRV